MMKKPKYARGTYLTGELIQSRAFTELSNRRNSGVVIRILLYFRLKLVYGPVAGKPGKSSRKVPINDRDLQFTYIEAKGLGITAGQFDRAIDLLVEFGFLDVEATGMGLHKMTTTYGLSDRWKKWGTPEFQKVKRKKSTQFNVGFQKGNTLWKRRKKKTTVTDEHSAMLTDEHGGRYPGIIAMFTDRHGKKRKTFYKRNGKKWLASQIA